MQRPIAKDLLEKLEVLVGEWRVEATGPDGTRWPGEGRTTFEWHESGAHLVQRSTTDAPGAPDSVSIIGCDGDAGTYHQLYSDDRGVCRVYRMSIDGTEWRLLRSGEPFAQRFIGRFADGGGRIFGRWEKAEDGATYELDFELTYVRLAGAGRRAPGR